MVTPTSAEVDWRTAVAALAAAAEVPVALVSVGSPVGADDPVRGRVAGLLDLPGAERLSLDRARDLVTAVRQAHGLVLVVAPAGLLVPLGADGWTLADLAEALRAPAVVVTGAGTDAVNHTTLMLGALAGHGIAAAVVTIGEVDESALPVTPAGRIPADRPPAEHETPADALAGAAGWFDPILLASPPPAPAVLDKRPAVSGKRIVLALVAVFAVMVLLVCAVAWTGRTEASLEPTSRAAVSVAPPATTPPVPRPPVGMVCPEYAGPVDVGRPDAATTARVTKAWQRIEKWLAAHAPAGARVLGRPAPASRIDDVQRRMSVPFPPDLVASLRRHDGLSAGRGFDLPPFFAPSALDGILADWRLKCEILARTGDAWDEPWWDRDFVPFAEAGDGGSLLVDQRPGGHGRVGETFPEDGTSFERWPASVAELLEKTATSLETGRPYEGRYRPRVDQDGMLVWEIV